VLDWTSDVKYRPLEVDMARLSHQGTNSDGLFKEVGPVSCPRLYEVVDIKPILNPNDLHRIEIKGGCPRVGYPGPHICGIRANSVRGDEGVQGGFRACGGYINRGTRP